MTPVEATSTRVVYIWGPHGLLRVAALFAMP